LGLSLAELAQRIGARLRGDGARPIKRLAALHEAGPEEVSFLANRRYRKFLKDTRAAAVILSGRDANACPTACLVVEDPYLGYARAATALNPEPPRLRGVHAAAWVSDEARVHAAAWIGPQAVVEARAVIGPRAFVGPGCVVGEAALVGEDCRLVANVSLCHGVKLGRRVLIHPGAVIGADGFGLANDGGVWVKIPQLGSVRLGDDVEIGANTTIDRGALGDTVIDQGVKLDNQVQVGHGCHIGAHTVVAGTAGIAGSVMIGRRCAIGGGVGINGHVRLADDVHVTGRSVVYQSVTEAGVYSSGMPLQENIKWRRNFPRYRQLDDMMRRITAVEDKLE